MQVGDMTAWERTFTRDDVIRFGELSGDQGIHHINEDGQGRLMVQGLLTATLPTKLGGDINFIASKMNFEFLRPVFTGETIRCESTITHVEQAVGRIKMACRCVCRNQRGKEVMIVVIDGIIREPVASE